MHCPKCKSVDFIKSGQIEGKQRYKCRSCKCQFTKNQKPGVALSTKMHAAFLFLNGLSMNAISRLFDVAPPTVMRWINFFKEKLGQNFTEPQQNFCNIKAQELAELSKSLVSANFVIHSQNILCITAVKKPTEQAKQDVKSKKSLKVNKKTGPKSQE